MTIARAVLEKESAQKYGDKMDPTPKSMDSYGAGAGTDPIPAPEVGRHKKSHAAHLGGSVQDHTKPEGDLRYGVAPGELREPPQDIRRVGKQKR